MATPSRHPWQEPAAEGELRWPLVVFPRSAAPGERALALRGCAERYLPQLGSVLFRGFGVEDQAAFQRFVRGFGSAPLEPWGSICLSRAECGAGANPGLFGSAVGAAGALHHAYAHTRRWPAKLWLHCSAAPEELLLADGRDVWLGMPGRAREQLVQRGIAYDYELSAEGGVSARELEQLAERLRAHGLSCQPRASGGLLARAFGPVALTHQHTGQLSWFNQAHLFPALPRDGAGAEAASTLRWRDAAGRRWSATVRHADGGTIEPQLLGELAAAWRRAVFHVPWEPGDVLLLDNEVTAHGWQLAPGQSPPAVIATEPREAGELAASRFAPSV